MTSESVEMYLVMTALLRQGKLPVPLSQLAQHLSVSPVSTNEMCRKLEERGLVEYQPYKGVTLTAEGNTLAQRILRRRHLWATFLTEKLDFEPEEADTIACQLEHVSSDQLTERLASFLQEDPSISSPLAPPQSFHPSANIQPLDSLTAGQQGEVVSILADDVVRDFLRNQGVMPGKLIDVLAVTAERAVLLRMENHCVSLSREIAEHIEVLPVEEEPHPPAILPADHEHG